MKNQKQKTSNQELSSANNMLSNHKLFRVFFSVCNELKLCFAKLLNRAHKKLSAIEAWENSQKASIEAELKKIEVKLNFPSFVLLTLWVFLIKVN